ncbi:hypothetical protein PybrP1_011557 [[Pythium] brassicae (nom. inval.)]|nr:hypothetical protein PybrP1_011557 [[Pythium] brassicae (nom. inval.)]
MLVATDEQLFTLDEALALLDTPIDLLLDIDVDDSAAPSGTSSLEPPPKNKRGRPTTATNASEETVAPVAVKKVYVRRDPRKEIAALKQEKLELEERHTLLQRHSANRTSSSCGEDDEDEETSHVGVENVARWAERSLTEFQRREHAERTNKALRAALARQATVSLALSAIFRGETGAAQEHTEWSAAVVRPRGQELTLPAPDDHNKLFTQLYHYLEALYCNTSFALDRLSAKAQPSSSSSCQTQDPALGLVVEMALVTPVLCEFGKLEKLLWARILANTMTHECHQFENRHKRRVAQTSDCVEKHVHLSFRDTRGPIALGGVSVTRKFSDAHRTVFVLTTRTRCGERDVQLREDSWMVVSGAEPSGASPPTSRFQLFHRTYVDRASRARATPELRELQDSVVRSASARVHEHQMLILMLLSEEFGASPAGLGPVPCPQIQVAAV